MLRWTPEFRVLLGERDILREQLRQLEVKVQKACPHVHEGTSQSAFPPGISFTDCTICGISNHDV